MKAVELMIGDIVLYHKTHELLSIEKLKKPIDKYIRIESIIEEGVNEEYCQEDIDWIRYNEIEPVPLTEEILEKNGFFIKSRSRCQRMKWLRIVIMIGGRIFPYMSHDQRRVPEHRMDA